MLKVTGLSKSYDGVTYAVSNLSFAVEDGVIMALLGHNGAGKSTTLRMVATALGATSGCVDIDGVDVFRADVNDLRRIKRSIGLVPESANLLDYLTPWEYLFYMGQMYGVEDEAVLANRVDELIVEFDIGKAREKAISDYSSGLKKRISIASVLVDRARLFLLDEPTAHLDPVGVRTLKDRLRRLRSEGAAIVLATHRLDIAELLADEFLIINEGREVFYGTRDDLHAHIQEAKGADSLESFYARLTAD
jgi:ABC-2 type transport system ATP-binding protein